MPKITIHLEQRRYFICTETVKKQFLAVLKKEHIKCDELIVHYVTPRKIKDLHKIFFNDPSTTDCITFPIHGQKKDNRYSILGEIFICPATAKQYAHDHEKNNFEELTLYLVHGFLHLIGYNDILIKDKKIMRQKEKECILFLKEKGLL